MSRASSFTQPRGTIYSVESMDVPSSITLNIDDPSLMLVGTSKHLQIMIDLYRDYEDLMVEFRIETSWRGVRLCCDVSTVVYHVVLERMINKNTTTTPHSLDCS